MDKSNIQRTSVCSWPRFSDWRSAPRPFARPNEGLQPWPVRRSRMHWRATRRLDRHGVVRAGM